MIPCPACKGLRLLYKVPNAQTLFTSLLPPDVKPEVHFVRCRKCWPGMQNAGE